MDINRLPYVEIQADDDREAWLEARRQGIGASEAPGVLGLSKWSSPTSIAASKIAGEPEHDSEILEAGRRMEPMIIEWAGEKIATRVRSYGVLLQSKVWPWMLATPDAVIGEPTVFGPEAEDPPQFLFGFPEHHYPLQCKNTQLAEDWKDEPPPAVVAQVQHELAVTGAKVGYTAALIMGNRLRWARIERDDEFISNVLVPETYALWQKIEKRERIEPDASQATKKALQRLYPEDTGEEIALPGEFIEKDEWLQTVKAEVKKLRTEIDGVENELREAMGSATIGVLANGVRFKYRLEHRKEHTVKASSVRVLRRLKAKS